MLVEAKFICADVVGPLKSGPYEIAEGSSVSDLIKTCLARSPGRRYENVKDMLIYLRNGKQAQPDTKLSEGDTVHILLKVFGG